MMIGVDGRPHAYPEWLFVLFWRTNRRLVKSGAAPILERPHKSPYLKILPVAIAVLKPLFDLPDYNPRRRLHAFDPSYSSGKAKRSGRKGLADLLACGLDAAIARREAEAAAAAIDNTPMPGRAYSRLLADEALEETRRTRGRLRLTET
jgi:hypothetical protein